MAPAVEARQLWGRWHRVRVTGGSALARWREELDAMLASALAEDERLLRGAAGEGDDGGWVRTPSSFVRSN